MTEVQIIDYFHGIATNLRAIAHLEVSGKRRFAASLQEAVDGMRNKINFNHHCMVLQFMTASYENNAAELQLKYVPLNIFIVRTCKDDDFASHYQAWTEAAVIWEKVLSKLLKDRDQLIGIRNFDKSRISVDYVRGEILEKCYGIVVELRIQGKADTSYYPEDWLDEVEELTGLDHEALDDNFILE